MQTHIGNSKLRKGKDDHKEENICKYVIKRSWMKTSLTGYSRDAELVTMHAQ